jgi:hypothetical protein
VEKYCRAGQATDDGMIRRMRIACCVTKTTDTYTHTHSQCVILFACPQYQWLRERASSVTLYVHRPCSCSRRHFVVRFASDLVSSVLPCPHMRMGRPALKRQKISSVPATPVKSRRAPVSALMRQIPSAEVYIAPGGQALKSTRRFATIIKVSYLPTYLPTHPPTHPLPPTYLHVILPLCAGFPLVVVSCVTLSALT